MATRQQFQDQTVVTTTPTSLYALMAVIDPRCPLHVSNLEVFGDDGNAVPVYCGGAQVSSTHYAYAIQSLADKWAIQSGETNAIALNQLYVRAASGTPTIHIRATVR